MGRPIKKKWFGIDAGSIQLEVDTGIKTIALQKGSNKFLMSDGTIVRLVEHSGVLLAGEARLEITLPSDVARKVRKLTQHKVYCFDGTIGVWNDASGNIIGTFTPAVV